jgi:condensin-2 complex subunit D3
MSGHWLTPRELLFLNHVPALHASAPLPQELKHPLLGQLMVCMASLLRDYKSELEDILVADKQVGQAGCN